jgi:membrane protease YdiL (CAAX protease family)
VLIGVTVVGIIVANTIPLARGVVEIVPVWVSLFQFSVGLGLVGLTTLVSGFRPLRTLAIAVVAIQAQWLLFQFNVSDEVFGSVATSDTADTLLSECVELAPAVVVLVVLGAIGYSRSDLLLRISSRSQTTDFTWIPGVQTEWSWRRATAVVGAFFTSMFLGIRLLTGVDFAFGAHTAGELAVILPVVLLAAAMNSFQERALFAAIPLGELSDAIGQSRTVILLAAMFGLSHAVGTPGGIIGIVLTGILGWVLAKIMIETRSIAAAWVIHWLHDVIIFLAILT